MRGFFSILTRTTCLWVVLRLLTIFVRSADPEPTREERKAAFEAAVKKLPWVSGPQESSLGRRATLKYPGQYRFLDGTGAKKYLTMFGNHVENRDVLGMVEHAEDKWWVVFEFDEVGYVKDDEKNQLNADKILKSYQESTAAQNEERGGPPTRVVGWHTKPRYNEQTHNLEWAMIFENSGSKYVNYRVKLLGRKGVVDGTWVGDLDQIDAAVPAFREVLKEFKYTAGETYGEYRAGDKVAKYGLGALVLGGAALGAAKFGLFAKLALLFKKGFKLIVIGAIAVASWIKSLFSGKKRREGDL